ncbi:MAG: hypothetical protein N2572_08870 [Syntrophales bacterium]|nr:hypothetical protein [Syntrophales bacterium]
MQIGRYTVIIIFLLLMACVSGPKEAPSHKNDEAIKLFQRGLEEILADKYRDAQMSLSECLRENTPGQIRVSAEAYLKLLNELASTNEAAEKNRAEMERLERELREAREILSAARQEIKRNQEKCQKEIDEIKRDLEFLKEVDMELQRRGRAIRP